MKAILTIALREWRTMFLSPLAWSLLAVLFAIAGWMFNAALANYQYKQMQFQAFGSGASLPVTDMTVMPVLGNAAVLMLLILPLVTMRLIADEKRRETWAALASSPLMPMQIVLGKYLGLLLFLLVLVGLMALLPLALYPLASPDTGQILSGLLGLFLVGAAFGAVGLATSSATDNPIVAAISAFGILLGLWISTWMGESTGEGLSQLLAYLSLMDHFSKFLQGVVSSTDLAYFLILIAASLLFARQRLLAERISG